MAASVMTQPSLAFGEKLSVAAPCRLVLMSYRSVLLAKLVIQKRAVVYK